RSTRGRCCPVLSVVRPARLPLHDRTRRGARRPPGLSTPGHRLLPLPRPEARDRTPLPLLRPGPRPPFLYHPPPWRILEIVFSVQLLTRRDEPRGNSRCTCRRAARVA